MAMANSKKKQGTIYWIIQDNQTTPFILDFLKATKQRLQSVVNLEFMIPEISPELIKQTKSLTPRSFPVSWGHKNGSYRGYELKKQLMGDSQFSDGLLFADTLLLDDLGGGNLRQTRLHLPAEKNIKGVILQIPTPLGSSNTEERLFQAWVLWAKQQGIPVIGYELLPLDTRWTLAPSMLDGVITTRRESYNLLTKSKIKIDSPVWLLPRHEGRLFSPAATSFWSTGFKAAYHYCHTFDIAQGIIPLYIPHNVALIWEYKKLLSLLRKTGKKIHLMFATGKDQVRGTHSHEEIIKTVCRDKLNHFASYSFHDINAPWEMAMAAAVVACSSCFATAISTANTIPTIIYDPTVPTYAKGYKETVITVASLRAKIETIICEGTLKTDLAQIFFQLINRGKSRG